METNEYLTEMARRHNNANILCLGGRVISGEKAIKLTRIFLATDFDGGRHIERVNSISDIESKNGVL
jgi:ribose 5-phosphate isomerase B